MITAVRSREQGSHHMRAVDLHTHSTRSDGSYTPSELVDYAAEKGLAAIALTDHDTVDGLDEAISHARAYEPELEVIPGIEFSTEYEKGDVHIVGLYIDYHGEAFSRKIQEFVDSRINRNIKMCEKLTMAGIPVTYEQLLAEFPDAVITRAHYARHLLSHGYTKSMKEAFDRYIGDHAPCYVQREKVTPVQAVRLILEAGGIPVLAHPVLYHMSDTRLRGLVAQLRDAGLMGIEAIYSTYAAADERDIRRIAADYDLCISGGSDFHGANKPGLDLGTGYGHLFVPEEVLTNLKAAWKKGKTGSDVNKEKA